MFDLSYSAASDGDIPFIRDTYLENIEALHGVFRDQDDFRRLLEDRASSYYVVRAKAPVAWFRTEIEDGELWLGMLQVHPAYQRRGVGKYVLSVLEELASKSGIRRVGVHTTEDNLAARALYASAGFAVTEIGPCTTADGKERVGYTFEKTLPDPAVMKTVEKAVVCYGAYGKKARKRVGALLSELGALDRESGERWNRIMRLWENCETARPLHYGVLPDGLPDTNELCIVVLGYMLNPDGSMEEEQIRRLEIALTSARKYPRARVVCTGGATAVQNSSASEAGEMVKWLLARGIEEDRLAAEDRSLTTAQNAAYTIDLLSARFPCVRKLAVVTSDYHVPTVRLLFDAAAILRAEAPGKERLTVVSDAAVRTCLAPLPAFFQAGALLELCGCKEAAYDVYYDRYDLTALPPPD